MFSSGYIVWQEILTSRTQAGIRVLEQRDLAVRLVVLVKQQHQVLFREHLSSRSCDFLDWKLDLGEHVVKMFSAMEANLAARSNDGVGIVLHPGSQCLIGCHHRSGISVVQRTSHMGNRWECASGQPSLAPCAQDRGVSLLNWCDNLH